MSHYVKVSTQIKNMEIMKKVAREMGYLIMKNTLCRGYGRQTQECDYVLMLPGEYDLGFQYNKEKVCYEIVADFWRDHISKYLGIENAETEEEKIGKLLQNYAKEQVLDVGRRLGYMPLLEKETEDGSIELTLDVGGGNYGEW